MARRVLRWRRCGLVAAVQKLQELDGEFDVADPAMARLDLGMAFACLAGFLLDAAFQRLDFINLAEAKVLAIDKRLDVLEKRLAQLEIARDRPQLDERLALPGSAKRVVVR